MSANPVVSVIMPCRNSARTLEDALAGVLASPLRDLEVLAVDDGSADDTLAVLNRIAMHDARVKIFSSGGRGVSAARNTALRNAAGEFVFFIDADDVIESECIPKSVTAMRRDNADYCRFAHDEVFLRTGQTFSFPLKADYRFDSPDDIREKYLPCFFGYSMKQVREWFRGVPLTSGREKGTVWSGCFRLDVIRDNEIWFDETIEIFEDAMFLCEYLLACRRTTVVEETMYHYRLSAEGSLMTKLSGPQFFGNKLRLLAKREELDVKAHGRLTYLYSASCVFSALEILRESLRIKGCFLKGMKTFCIYVSDPVVKTALRAFPLSWRKPALSVSVAAVAAFVRVIDALSYLCGKKGV